ncbi:MAG: NAD(P)H-dependent oxidoreductase [Saprospiraceae bacterium]
MKAVIIMGSARKDGESHRVVNALQQASGWDLIDLNDYQFTYYDYEHKNRDDEFLPMVKRIITEYDTLVFATPVYWYSMSGIMKVFFDRLTDLITIEKDWGRKLRGKNMAGIANSYGNHLGDSFWLPFRMSADYLGMQFLADQHIVVEEEFEFDQSLILDFVKEVQAAEGK